MRLNMLLLAPLFPLLLTGGTVFADDGETALWDAAKRGDAKQVDELIRGGVDPDAEFRSGGCALLFAADRGHLDVVETLLRHGASVDAKEQIYRWTALHWAAFRGHRELIGRLLKAGADPNATETEFGNTPLMMAVQSGDPDCVAALLDHAERMRLDQFDQALSLAEEYGDEPLVRALREARSRVPRSSDWPQFRGPSSGGIAYDQDPPIGVDWEDPATFWKTPIPGLGHSSPVVVGGRIFVTTAVSSDPHAPFGFAPPMASSPDRSLHTWLLFALDASNGDILWSRKIHEGAPKFKRHPRNSFASSTPATNGERIVVFLGSEGLFCYGCDGELKWRRSLGPMDSGWFYDPDYQWGTASSPIISENRVFLQCDLQRGSFLAAFDLADGKTLWRTPRDEYPSWSTPALVDGGGGPELVTNGYHYVRGYDPLTGNELWRLMTGNSNEIVTSPVGHADLVYVANGSRPQQPIYAIRTGARGEISPSDSRYVPWSKDRGGPYLATPLAYGRYLYLAGRAGTLACYQARNGQRCYLERLAGTAITASPVAAAGRIYFVSEDGEVAVVRAGEEFSLLNRFELGEEVLATPAISQDMLFLRTTGHVIGIRRGASGEVPE